MRDREELAWAAGFFDGEGYVGLAHQHWKDRCRRQLHAHIAQTDPRPLERFQAAIGFGRVTKRNTDTPYLANKQHWKDQWRWDVSSFEHVQAMTAMLWVFLCPIKQEQARGALLAYYDWRQNSAEIQQRCDKRLRPRKTRPRRFLEPVGDREILGIHALPQKAS